MIGLVRPGTIKSECRNSEGKVRVNKEKCSTCPYIKDSPFNYQLNRIHKANEQEKSFNICHNSLPEDVEFSMCRGSYDALKDKFNLCGEPVFVEVPKSEYIVTPWGD